jgi:hypothetical protein
MSAPTESQHLAEFVVNTNAGRGLQPPVRLALAAGLLAVHRNHDVAQRALSRVDDGLCRRVTNYVPSARFQAKTYRPRGVDLVIPYVRDHGAPPPRRRHRVEARIPRSDKKPYFRVLPIRRDAEDDSPDPAHADPNRYVKYHELVGLERRLQRQLKTVNKNMAKMNTIIKKKMTKMAENIAELLRRTRLTN